MKIKIISSFLSAALLIFLSNPAFAQTASEKLKELYNQREEYTREIYRNREAIKQKEKEKQQISGEIKKIDGNISVTEGKISDIGGKINQTQIDIENKTLEIAQQESEIARLTGQQNETIKVIYETGEENPYLLLLGSNNISEAVDRANYLEALEVQIESTITKVEELRNQLVSEKTALQAQKEELNNLKSQQEAYKKGLEYEKNRKNELLVDAKIAIQNYEKLLAQAKAAYQDVNSELYKIQEAARAKAKRGGSKKVGNITFVWPFSGTITASFGEATPIQSFHTGTDIDGVIGDGIVAAAKGEVTFVGGNSDWGYGLYIDIDHGNEVSTRYGHLSGFTVEAGTSVEAGELIGYMGNTGFAIAYGGGDGSHLHFEVRESGVPVDPMVYLP